MGNPLGMEVSHKHQTGEAAPFPSCCQPTAHRAEGQTSGNVLWMGQEGLQGARVTPSGSHLHQVRFQMSRVALVQTQVLMETPVPNMAKRLIFSTSRLGRFLISQSGMGLLVCVAMVTLASHLRGHARDSGCREGGHPTARQAGWRCGGTAAGRHGAVLAAV